MSNKERGLHGNCYCTFDLRVRWLRWACRRDGDSMKVGDLVKCLTGSCGTAIIVEFHKTSGLFWIMMTRNGRMCAFQPQHLEVISASR